MTAFHLEIAGQVASVTSLFESTPHHFSKYLTDRDADFSIRVTPEDLVFEQQDADTEAAEEGFRQRNFPDPFLERAAIQRSFAAHLLERDTILLHGSTLSLDGRGYLFTARMVVSYVDYIIRHDMEAFKQVGFIGTPWANTVDI